MHHESPRESISMQQLSILFEQLPWHKWSLEYNLGNAVPVSYVILACCYCSLNHQHRSGCEGSLTLYLRIWHLISIQFKFSLTLPQTICKCEPPGDKWEWGMLNKPPISLCFSISKWSCQTRILLFFLKKSQKQGVWERILGRKWNIQSWLYH